VDQLLCQFDEADQEAMLADLAVFRRELGWSPRLVTHHLAVTDLTPSELALRCGGRVERSCVVGMGMVQTVRSSSRATGQPYLGSARQAIDLKPPGYSAVFLVTAVPTPDLVVDLFETLAIDAEDLREVPFGTVLPTHCRLASWVRVVRPAQGQRSRPGYAATWTMCEPPLSWCRSGTVHPTPHAGIVVAGVQK
jgi:hypothetical protein